jgi:hypothetical protein
MLRFLAMALACGALPVAAADEGATPAAPAGPLGELRPADG